MTSDPHQIDSFVMTAFFFEAALGVAALGVGWMIGVDPLATLPITVESLGRHLMAILWGVAAAVPLLVGLLLLNRLRFRSIARIRGFVDARIVPFFQPLSLFELGAISFAAGFGEETLFRGLVQAGIAQSLDAPSGAVGAVAAVVVASIAFGICHWITPAYAVLATLAGAYFGSLFLWTENLLAPLVAHALYDFVALVYLTRRSRDEEPA